MSAPSDAQIDAAMRFIDTAREAMERMIAQGSTPMQVATTIGAVLGEATIRTEPGGEAELVRMAVQTAADFLADNGRPLPLLVGVVEPDADAETRH